MGERLLNNKIGAVPVTRALIQFWPESLRRRVMAAGVLLDGNVGGLAGRLRASGQGDLARQVLTATQWWVNVQKREW